MANRHSTPSFLAARETSWDLPAHAEAVRDSRDMVRETLTAWGLSAPVSDVLVIVSELHTNAIRYGAAPITLRLRLTGRCLGGEVADRGTHFAPPPRPADDQENGRGLQIVAALSTGWGIDPQPDGKAVWFTRCW
ncbi:ATP-binding protein [Sphaerisporangium aureirubrum]|uniref:ATP-binding protein n=1 Tax=Sphaerisporangium aureirubrum TaxID=1544736 RepID=A0ABW1ND60_9ACTN